MELKLGVLVHAINMKTFMYLNNTRGMKSVIAYRISKNIKEIKKEIDVYEEQRKKLCENYAEKDENGNAIIKNRKYDISKENIQMFNDELKKLEEETVDINIKKVSIEDI